MISRSARRAVASGSAEDAVATASAAASNDAETLVLLGVIASYDAEVAAYKDITVSYTDPAGDASITGNIYLFVGKLG